MTTESTLPIYENGLKFSCTSCGKCCTGGPGYVWVSEKELQALAKHFSLPLEEFKKKYTRFKGGRYALLEKQPSYDCIFLEGKQCQIYNLRPVQCRTYPWWPELLRDKAAWQEAAKECEGISNEASLVPKKEIEAALQKHEEGQEAPLW